jgi:hypothetical protein
MKLDVTFHKYLVHILVDREKEQKLANPSLEVEVKPDFPFRR